MEPTLQLTEDSATHRLSSLPLPRPHLVPTEQSPGPTLTPTSVTAADPVAAAFVRCNTPCRIAAPSCVTARDTVPSAWPTDTRFASLPLPLHVLPPIELSDPQPLPTDAVWPSRSLVLLLLPSTEPRRVAVTVTTVLPVGVAFVPAQLLTRGRSKDTRPSKLGPRSSSRVHCTVVSVPCLPDATLQLTAESLTHALAAMLLRPSRSAPLRSAWASPDPSSVTDMLLVEGAFVRLLSLTAVTSALTALVTELCAKTLVTTSELHAARLCRSHGVLTPIADTDTHALASGPELDRRLLTVESRCVSPCRTSTVTLDEPVAPLLVLALLTTAWIASYDCDKVRLSLLLLADPKSSLPTLSPMQIRSDEPDATLQ